MSVQPEHLAALHDLVGDRRLTPVQRRVIHTIAEHLEDADSLSSAELASLAGVSQPSVVRLAAALGFATYQEFRAALRAIVRSQRPSAADEVRLSAIRDEVANLTWLERHLAATDVLATAGDLAAASSPLLVVGLRASAPLAHYLGFYLRKVHPWVVTVTHAGSEALDLLDEAIRAGARCAIVLALPRWPRELLTLLDLLTEAKTSIVCLADRPHGPLQDHATTCLVTPVGTSLLYDTHATAFVAAQLLVQAVAEARPKVADAAMEAFEARASRYRYFLAGEDR